MYSQFYSFFCHLFSLGQVFPFVMFMSGCCPRTTQIDFTWALERTASKFCKFKTLPLLLSKSSWQILFCFFRRKMKFLLLRSVSIFYLFFSLFLPHCSYPTRIPPDINNLPHITFSVLLPFFLHLYPCLVFLIVTQVMRSQPYIVLLCFWGAGGLASLYFLKVPHLPLTVICEICLFFMYLLAIPFQILSIPHIPLLADHAPRR